MTSDSGRFTLKQIDVLETIMKGDDDGGFIDMDQLLDRVSYETTKPSMQFTIRALVARGLVEKKPRQIRRGRLRAIFCLTPQALKSFDAKTSQFDIVEEGLSEVIEALT